MIRTVNHGKDKIDIRGLQMATYFEHGAIEEARLDEIRLKENGAVGDKPSFAFVLTRPHKGFVLTQVSLDMLARAFKDLGYRLEKER